MKKHDIIEVTVDKISFPNKGIAYLDGKKVIIKDCLPGQVLKARVYRVKSDAFAKPLEVLRQSQLYQKPDCDEFGNCGGCSYQNMSYDDEVQLKYEMVQSLFRNAGMGDSQFCGIVKAVSEKGYRNKMEYTFGDEEKGGQLSLGMRKKNSYYEVVNARECRIVHADFGMILQATLDFFRQAKEPFYHKGTHEGALRNLIVRKGFFTDEILVNIVTSSAIKTDMYLYAEHIMNIRLEGHIVGIIHTISDSFADAVKADTIHLLHGRDYFMEKLLGRQFKISTFSFFQTNSAGAESLYSTVKEFAGEISGGTIFDLYCGTGTISQIMSANAEKVVGVELVEEAVEAARDNARLNNITNCEFIAGDVLKIVEELEQKPDLIILDPPREGVHPKALDKIISFCADRMIYVSCNPVSLVSNLDVFLKNGYRVEKIRCHDLFPRTRHVECVVLISQADD